MITCLGLIVGIIKSVNTQDVLNQCAKFLCTHKYLIDKKVDFEIEGQVYATVVDTCKYPDGKFGVLFNMYDGFTKIGVCQEV